MINVVHPGIYSSVQDQGRQGFAQLGVPVSGSMDAYSSEMGNVLLKNKPSDAVIEVTFGRAKFEFITGTFICLTGADFSPKLNGESLQMMTVYEVSAGSILSFGKRNYGLRTYIAVQGGVQSEQVLKSRSFFKGITSEDRIKKGDQLPILPKKPYENLSFSKIKIAEELFSSHILECHPGPEFDQLNPTQKEQLFQPFTLSEDHNRVGYRLNELVENDLQSILTSAVLPGTVQLTPSGTLIVLMRDCQVTGGYPRVLQLTDFAINQLSQKLSNDQFSFDLKI
jgi:biotin-dependent carboxylase-like uncharacterized protein